MKIEDIHVTIAELMGYTWICVTREDETSFVQLVEPSALAYCRRAALKCEVIPRPVDMETEWKNTPDYTGSLDAMHEVWVALIRHVHEDVESSFMAQLLDIVKRDTGIVGSPATAAYLEFYMVGATAAQRAEAVLRVKGRWKDDES